MRRVLLLVIAAACFYSVNAQVFNTGQTLKRGVVSLGLEPTIHVDGGANGPMFFAHAGYGLKKGIDISVKAGAGRSRSYYVGGDIEFALAKRISLAFGAHKFNDFGLDGTFNFVIPVTSDVRIFSGCDSDLNFGTRINSDGEEVHDMDVLVWIPIGVEVGISKSINLIFEVEIGVAQGTYHVMGGGINFYF